MCGGKCKIVRMIYHYNRYVGPIIITGNNVRRNTMDLKGWSVEEI